MSAQNFRKTFTDLHDRAVQLHEDIVGELMVMREPTNKMEVDDGVLVDVGFLLREMERHFDEMRKDVKSRKELIGRLLCLRCIKGMQSGEKVSLRGELATGSPDLGKVPEIPARGTPQYEELMTFLGVPKEAYENGVVVPHWKHVQELLNELAAQGKDAPPGVGERPDYKMTFTKRRKRNG